MIECERLYSILFLINIFHVVFRKFSISFFPIKTTSTRLVLFKNVGIFEQIYITGCRTKGGRKCVFPFKSSGKIYQSCTEDGHNTFWCSTSNKADGSYDEWDNCDVTTCGKGTLFKYDALILLG